MLTCSIIEPGHTARYNIQVKLLAYLCSPLFVNFAVKQQYIHLCPNVRSSN